MRKNIKITKFKIQFHREIAAAMPPPTVPTAEEKRCHHPSCHNCLPTLPLLPTRTLSQWCFTSMTQLDTHWEAATGQPFRVSMNVQCLWNLLLMMRTGDMDDLQLRIAMICLAALMPSSPHQEIINWHSCSWDVPLGFHHRRQDDNRDNPARCLDESGQGPKKSLICSCSSFSGGPTRCI